jgi:peptidoglycan/LPS O-acetylase OafA/YrhL
MAYVQLSLLHVPAIIIHGNTLSLEAEAALRLLLAATLIVVAGILFYDHFENTLSLLTAFARRPPY